MITPSSAADSIDVVETCDTLRFALLTERRLLVPPVKSRDSRIIAKYRSGDWILGCGGVLTRVSAVCDNLAERLGLENCGSRR
jgi:hypothetical protein